MPDPTLQTRPQFPRINKAVRLYRKAIIHYMEKAGQAKFPPIPYWRLLVPTKPTAPVPVDPHRAPTVPVTEAADYPPNHVPLTDDLTLVGYPQPPERLHEPVQETTLVDAFGEAEWDKRKFRPFVCPAHVKIEHKAVLTKFGRVQTTTGTFHVSRFILEEIGLEPGPGDLFQWGGKLRQVIDAFKQYGYVASTDYWTWLEIPYDDFQGDSSNLELPVLEDVPVPELPDEQ